MLLSFSFSIERTPFELLEQLSKRSEDIAAALDDPTLTAGSVVVATCNRFEVYAEAGASRSDAVLARIAAASGIAEQQLRNSLHFGTDRETVEHLFSVAAGLKSAVVGESEIAGQVRRAHDDARELGTLTHNLEHLFRTATRTSREVGHRTDIRSSGRSLVRLALRISEARIPTWEQAKVLLIGTGAYSGATVSALRARGVETIHVFSQSGRAAEYAAQHELTPVPIGGLAHALTEADLVVACTRADDPVLTPESFRAWHDKAHTSHQTGETRSRPLLLIDLGMPRNIDPAVAELAGIELLDLETIAKHSPVEELSAEAEAQEIVLAAAAEFSASQAERDALPVLLALRSHVFGILEDELCRARKAAGATLNTPMQSDSAKSPDHFDLSSTPALSSDGEAAQAGDSESDIRAAEVEAALRRFTGKLLHTPMTRIRTLGREGRVPDAVEAIETLFGLDPHASQDH
ncbi:glutamyl-tRNA reductase [Leucobacter sp. UT-8R-CII-1-4]|uniref:glutamyl-tRNA reductase n=1 Tax=Leucobacter sp. UT-8R-CII-1-4 TaxID=3040075 RepID=UPI0024A94D06|nr:glutamyl-tRNA reductase [Leucobacter sp. UT-8R-CII-1-4]MDI6022510.1 glutamyl-tRNA reductase [Leucobacter sp. UT-8R-CII-1-4]